jgi:tRNA-2-methylthio-N6-dimethylallyladenosine synthase
MAQLAVNEYQRLLLETDTKDPFAYLVDSMSLDKDDGGMLGWVDAPKTAQIDDWIQPRLTQSVIDKLYKQQPKSGDILTIQGPDYWHVLQVLEVWMDDPVRVMIENNSKNSTLKVTNVVPVGSYTGINSITPIKKLKGQGVLPEFPELQTYSIQTAGCQMNVADSERLAGILETELELTLFANSQEPVSGKSTQQQFADLIVLNTCSIRDHAEQKVYDALGPYAARKRQGHRVAIIVTGCVAQQEGLRLIQRVPEIDAVVGPQYVPHLKTILEQVSRGQQVVVTEPLLIAQNDVIDATTAMPTNQPVRNHNVRAWVNVIYGCNEHCSYCVVPATRGMEQSRTMESILQECLQLAERGYKEVTLIGQNVDAYGRDMVPKRTFADLLSFLNARIPTKMRIRYVTSHPRYFSNRVIDAVANLDKVCECFHMPFQAGDDQVLKRMRRGYTFDSYMKIIDRIKDKCPNAGITADIIVGFPGETEEAFQRTLDLMQAVKFDNVNSFVYSPRPNTEAALYEDQIPEDTKSERLQRVQQLAIQHGLERSQRYLGQTVEVLVEDANPRNPSKQVMGRTREGRQVYFDGELSKLMGSFVMVTITEARTWSLMGKRAIIEENETV